ncbi:alpha-amylase family glycosyl hydrolase [Flavobacteriaceae bacterium]|nr:alpha-amylase family glycosyl hydrolase [Flavobacteriaceae bacterium]MDB9730544.1 alpha-amylase family glycosyl hydrolase [Flavobacteriaceae bacterium]
MKSSIFICPAILLLLLFNGCKEKENLNLESSNTPFVWENANMYFLLTDRFNNGDKTNDINFNRTKETAVLRGFKGGDFAGVTQKINEGYFTKLGINALWFSPVVEQIHGATNEGTGNTYGFHGYWTKDWTAIEPNFGTEAALRTLVETAHANGIRIVMDVVLNHTGPVTEKDEVWPEDWVRTSPACTYDSYENTTACTLVKNLPDILTESNKEVSLPNFLLEKWKNEGRLKEELASLDDYFSRTGYPRTPQAYIVKWLTDYVKDFGIDGFRVDTVKHASETAWDMLYTEASFAFDTWKKNNPEKVLDQNSFYMMGEVYNYGISGGRSYDFGNKKVDYYAHGFHSLINFELKYDADKSYAEIFKKYDSLLNGPFREKSVLNYLTSHDDGQPYDKLREKGFRAANVLLLTPGGSQIYYGDETNRNLIVQGTEGDATLRSFMNWEEIDNQKELLRHWQMLGQFKGNHIAVGAGKHKDISTTTYVFSREYLRNKLEDKVIIGLDLPEGKKDISVGSIFKNGQALKDTYSGNTTEVINGKVSLDTPYTLVLLEAN